MRAQVVALRVGGTVFGIMCLAQLMRLSMFRGLAVHVGAHRFPLWPSAVAAAVLGGLCLWPWIVSFRTDR